MYKPLTIQKQRTTQQMSEHLAQTFCQRKYINGQQIFGKDTKYSLGKSETISHLPKWYNQESSSTPQLKTIDSSVLSFLYSPTLTSIHDYWKNHSFD